MKLRSTQGTAIWRAAFADHFHKDRKLKIIASLFAGAALTLGCFAQNARAQDVVRLRGSIEEMTAGVYTIRTRDNALVKLRLSPSASVAASIKSAVSEIKPGSYLGVAALPQKDGTLRALEAHIFDDTMRGTAEGHRAWDLLPESTMTNAVVQEIVDAVDGHSVMLRYKDGQKQILIPAGIPIVTYLPGSIAELKPGATVFIPAATSHPDGYFEAQRVMVGRTASPPQ